MKFSQKMRDILKIVSNTPKKLHEIYLKNLREIHLKMNSHKRKDLSFWYLLLKPGIHLSTIPGRVVPNQLGTLVWTALQAEENRLGSSLDPIHRLSVHQNESSLSHGSFVLHVALVFMLAYTFLH